MTDRKHTSWNKRVVGILYVLTLLAMAIATMVEKYKGTDFVHSHYYGAVWFSFLWLLLTVSGGCWIIRRKIRHWATLILHGSLVLILLGALLTHLTARKGIVHLRQGESTDIYVMDRGEEGMKSYRMPFSLTLDSFVVNYHAGTKAVADYSSFVRLTEEGNEEQHTIAMNKILDHHGYRFYQGSYDEDGKGSILALNKDRFGIPVTYAGYALFFFSLIYMLFDPKGGYRRLLRHPM